MDRLSAKELIEIWKNVIAVQMHFNTVEMTVRNIFATLSVALLGAIGYAYKEKLMITFPFCVSAASVIAIAAAVLAVIFYFVDRFWYHRLLIGSVKEATRLEAELSKLSDIEIKLSSQISAESPVLLPAVLRFPIHLFVWEKRFRQTGWLHSDAKIELFYKSIVGVFIIMAVIGFTH